MSGKYDDILFQERPISKNRKAISIEERAVQFSSYDALNGYEDVIDEAGRQLDQQIELEEEARQEIDRDLHRLALRLEAQCEPVQILLSWFEPDERMSGGQYRMEPVTVRKVNQDFCCLELTDHSLIDFDQIYHLKEMEK